MGSSISKNISTSVTKAIAKVSSDIIQNTKLSQDQSQIVSVKNVHGDVHVSRNNFKQKATINMKSLLDALSKEESQQKILMELAQHAKSITSGLNIGQYADSQNIMNTLIESTVDLLTTIDQTCGAFAEQFQEIEVQRVQGNVYITDNVLDEVYNILQNCTEKAVADSDSIQDLTNKLSQSASATSEGLSGWILVALIAIILGIPVLGVSIGGSVFLKFIFPIMLIIGTILLVLYYTNVNSKQKMKLVGFSSFIEQTPSCLSTLLKTESVKTAIDASKICLEDENCQAFDWKGGNVKDSGEFSKIEPVSNFYSSVSKDCMKNILSDYVNLLRTPDAFDGFDEPDEIIGSKEGDIYLNKKNGNWYQKIHVWTLMGVITNSKFSKIAWGTIDPIIEDPSNLFANKLLPNGQDKQLKDAIFVSRNIKNPLYFYVYKFNDIKNIWQFINKIKGPSLVSATPSIINSSGFKQLDKPEWMLYSGLICTIVGFAGTGLTFYFNK